MRFALTAEQEAFRAVARDLLARECPAEVVRGAWPPVAGERPGQGAGAGARAEPARVEGLWQHLAAVGVPGILVPEAAGGLGLDEVTAAVIWEECGYAAVPFGVVELTGVVAPSLAAAGGEREALLAAVLAGGARPCVVEEGARVAPWVGAATRHVVVVGEHEVRLVDLAGHSLGASVDGARHVATVAPAGAVVLAGARADLARQRAVLGTAAQLVGLARRMLDITVAYVVERRQYGVPVGSFQAVKHHLADVRLQLEFARPAVLAAAWALATAQPTAGRDVATAKALASTCARLAARQALQCHGAIGHTVEYDLHLYVKRAWALAAAWGDAAKHGHAVADALGL